MPARSAFTLGVFAVLSGTVMSAQQRQGGSPGWPQDSSAARTQAHPSYGATSRDPWAVVPIMEDTPGQQMIPSRGYPGTVSVQELKHNIPGKALKEMKKADEARTKKDIDKAILHLQRAVAFDPDYVAARNNLAALYLTRGEAKPALEQLEPAIKMDPHAPLPFSNLAVAYLMMRQFDAAERAARQTLDLARTSARAEMILGLTLVLQDKLTPEAETALERARPSYPQAHLLLGRVLAATGKLEEAEAEIKTYQATGEQTGQELAREWLDVLTKHRGANAALTAGR